MSWMSRFFLAALLVAAAGDGAAADAITQLSHRDRLYDATLAPGGDVFAIGHPGLLLRSVDGAKSFERVAAGQTDQALFSIAFNAHGQGAVVGRSGFFLVTSDRGASWRQGVVELEGEHPSLFSVAVLPDGVIVAVGEFGAIVRSEDQGKSWTRSTFSIAIEATPTAPSATSAKGRRSKRRGKHKRSQPQPAPFAQCVTQGSAEDENSDVVQEARLTDVAFLDAKQGLVVGEFGLILRSQDGGRSFQRRASCTDLMLFSVATASGQRAIAVGAEGSVVESSDGGLSWTRRSVGTSEHLFGVFQADRRTVVLGAAGTALVRDDTDGFRPIQSGVHGWLTAAALDEGGRGVLVGGRGYLRRTEDGAKTLTRVLGE